MIARTCNMCNQTPNPNHKIKNDYICDSCFMKFPKCIRENIENFSLKQIEKMQSLFRRDNLPVWIRYGGVSGLNVGKNHIRIDGYEIQIKDIKMAELNFYPTEEVNQSKLSGNITITVETFSPNILIEELIATNVIVEYKMKKNHRIYSLPDELVYVINSIHNGMRDINCDTTNNDFAKKRIDEIYRRTSSNSSNTNRNYQENTSERNNRSAAKQTYDKEINEYMLLYGVTNPFTIQQLKHTKKELLKIYHPDNGRPDAIKMSQIINRGYDVLKNLAS